MTAPGWYPDPKHPGSFIYWDGSRWTGHRQPTISPQKRNVTTWLVLGVACTVGLVVAIIGISTHRFKNMRDYTAGYNSVTENPSSTRTLDAAGGLNRFGMCWNYLTIANSSPEQYDYGDEDFLAGCYDGLDEVLGPGPHGVS